MGSYRITGPDGKSYVVSDNAAKPSSQGLTSDRFRSDMAAYNKRVAQDFDAARLGSRAAVQGFGRNIGIPWTNIDISHGLEALGMTPYEEINAQAEQAGPIATGARLGAELYGGLKLGSAALGQLKKIGPLAKTLADTGYRGLAARGAVEGGAVTAATGQSESPFREAATGATLGGLVSPIAAGLGRTGTGFPNVSDDATALLREGIPVTPGQALGESGMVGPVIRATEEALTSTPITGPLVQSLRGRGLEKLREKAITYALPPGMAVPKDAGIKPLKALREIGKEFSKQYKSALNAIPPNSLTVPGGVTAEQYLRQSVPPEFKESLLKAVFSIDDYITPPRMEHTTQRILQSVDFYRMSPEQIFKAQSDLRKLGNKLVSSINSTAEDRAVSGVFKRAADYILEGLEKGLPNGAGLQKLRGPYRNYINLLHETEKLKGFGGTMSPKAIQKAAMKAKNSKMEDLARLGGEVLPSGTPDSGTAGRAATLALFGGIGGGLAGGDIESAIKGTAIATAPMAAGLLMTNPNVAKAIYGQYPWQRAAAQAIPRFGALSAGIASGER